MGMHRIDRCRYRERLSIARARCTAVLGLLSFLVLASRPQNFCLAADDNALLSGLDQIEKLHLANTQRIATWKGTADVQASTSTPGLSVETTSVVLFAYDRDLDARRFVWHFLKSQGNEKGKDLTGNGDGGIFAWTRVGDTSYEMFPFFPVNKQRIAQKVKIETKPQLRRNIGYMTDWFDPLFYFNVSESDDISATFRSMRNLLKRDDYRLEMKREGQLVTLTEMGLSSGEPYRIRVFDLAQAGNLLKSEHLNPGDKSVVELKYQRVAEVWIPRSFSYERVQTSEKDGESRWKKVIHWTSNTVNEPLNNDDFTLDSMEISPGAYIYDGRIGPNSRPYKYK